MNPPIAPAVFARTCLCLAAKRAARILGRRFDETLRPAGLSNGQFAVLMLLSAELDLGLSALAAELAMDRTTLTAVLKPLRRDGLVAEEPDPTDRRIRRLRLTAAGRTALAAAVPLWQAAQAAAMAEFSGKSARPTRQNLVRQS